MSDQEEDSNEDLSHEASDANMAVESNHPESSFSSGSEEGSQTDSSDEESQSGSDDSSSPFFQTAAMWRLGLRARLRPEHVKNRTIISNACGPAIFLSLSLCLSSSCSIISIARPALHSSQLWTADSTSAHAHIFSWVLSRIVVLLPRYRFHLSTL
jgi:hypothetical protein